MSDQQIDSYTFPSEFDSSVSQFFSTNTLNQWTFDNFKNFNSKDNTNILDSTLQLQFQNNLNKIIKNNNVPDKVKGKTGAIKKQNKEKVSPTAANSRNEETTSRSGASKNCEQDGYLTDDSGKSVNYHPRRTTKYTINTSSNELVTNDISEAPKWIVDTLDIIEELKQFKDRSTKLAKLDANQISDLRLLSTDCIYLFAEEITKSVSKYLGSHIHSILAGTLIPKNFEVIDPIIFSWCMTLSNFAFSNPLGDKWMELQLATIGMLTKAAATNNKKTVQIANMLHTLAPRLLLSQDDSKVEDTFVHRSLSYAIKTVFGAESSLCHQWANGRLSQENEANPGKFKPDYVAYCRIRNYRFDLTVAEFKPPNGRAGSIISDKVKLGQQMKVMINKLIKHQVSNPVVGGILVEGKICSLYKMDLVGPCTYRMVQLVSFPLCTTRAEICLIPNILLYFDQLKNITVAMAKRVEERELARAKGKRKLEEEVVPYSWVHEGTWTLVKKTIDK